MNRPGAPPGARRTNRSEQQHHGLSRDKEIYKYRQLADLPLTAA
jgi:hypothetical protein